MSGNLLAAAEFTAMKELSEHLFDLYPDVEYLCCSLQLASGLCKKGEKIDERQELEKETRGQLDRGYNRVHAFLVRQITATICRISEKLKSLAVQMKEVGYTPDGQTQRRRF